MIKVGIIGAGLSGLTCSWRLNQKGIETVVFEKESYVGGRTLYSGAISSGNFDKRLYKLIKEFNLQELAIPLKKEEIGFCTEKGEVLDLKSFLNRIKKKFSLAEGLKLLNSFNFINSLNLDVENPDDKLAELREISFEEFLKRYPLKIAEVLRETACFFGETENANPRTISAEYGISIVRLANELQSGKAFTFEENNILALTNVLAKHIEEKGGRVIALAEVKKIEKKEKGFRIFYQKSGIEKTEDVDKVVLTVPLNFVKEIFPQLELETDVNYFALNSVFVKGDFKYPQVKVMKGDRGNPANFVLLYNLVPEYQLITYLPEQNINLDFLYNHWEIINKKIIKESLPIIGPKCRVPALKTNIEGVYLAGDFYYHTFMEVSVVTAEMVAKMIEG